MAHDFVHQGPDSEIWVVIGKASDGAVSITIDECSQANGITIPEDKVLGLILALLDGCLDVPSLRPACEHLFEETSWRKAYTLKEALEKIVNTGISEVY